MPPWGGESKAAKPGQLGVNNGLFVEELETAILIDNVAYSDILSFALDVRGRDNLNYRLNNADTITDGVFKILGTTKDFDNLSDLVLADFTETVVAENIDFGATIEAQEVLTTPIGNALITAVLVQTRKVVGNWNLTGIIRAK